MDPESGDHHHSSVSKSFLPVTHSLLMSSRIDPASLMSASSEGKVPTTLVLHLSSWFTRSMNLVVRIRFPWAFRNPVWLSNPGGKNSIIVAAFWDPWALRVATRVCTAVRCRTLPQAARKTPADRSSRRTLGPPGFMYMIHLSGGFHECDHCGILDDLVTIEDDELHAAQASFK